MEPRPVVGVLGGSFDPVHLGHLRIAAEVRQALRLDHVDLLLSPRPPHKDPSTLTPPGARAEMIRLAIRDRPGLRLSMTEFEDSGPGYTIADEFPADGFVYEKGILAMANRGPGTSGSQFFIMFEDGGLPPQYSVFGRAVNSDSTLDAIEAIPKEARGTELSIPMEGLFIERVDIEVNP